MAKPVPAARRPTSMSKVEGAVRKRAKAKIKAKPSRTVRRAPNSAKGNTQNPGRTTQPAERRTHNAERSTKEVRHATAEEMSQRQREISVAEFFTKNRHLLGFDNPRKALLTTIKEGVDNSLDACEEAGILPEVKVVIARGDEEDRYCVMIEDNGPGILKAQIPKIFAKLLYGSKFHRLKMSRGQQGIGISAAGMYGQLTTGKPITITSKTGKNKPAHHYKLEIDTKKNEPRIIADETVEWPVERGTKVEIELDAKYQKGRQSVEEYLEQTVIANPHVSLEFVTPDGEKKEYKQVSKELPVQTREIKPHPYGVELGMLIKMLHDTQARTLQSFLHSEFSRISSNLAKAICEQAKIYERARPTRIARQEADNLFKAINKTRIMNPPTDCLSPIGEELILAGLKKQIDADFHTAVTRPPSVYRGNPFQIEAGLAYGGSLPSDGLARVLRYANRVPLLYQQAACAITKSVLATSWRGYGIQQSAGALPSGPLIIMVHVASVRTKIQRKSKPTLAFPLRSLSNVKYHPKKGFLELKGKKKIRALTVSTVKTFAQTLRMMSQAKTLVEDDEIMTKREAYYVSKNWDDARFDEQPESDTVIDDIEALFEVNREQLGFIPEEKGGEVAGKLIVIDRDSDTGKRLAIDCTKFGSGAYSIPISVEHLKFETKAKFVLAIETAGMFQRLVKHNYWRRANCILVSMGGVPTRACRRFIRRLGDELKLPVYAFVDCDPYGMFNIYRTLKVGSGNAAHINRYFCVPNAQFLGVTPQDIVDYKLPTHPLKDVDIKRARDALKNDPFVQHYKPWQDAIKQLLEMGVRAEQQAFAVHDLNYVIEHYLPEKLAATKKFLP